MKKSLCKMLLSGFICISLVSNNFLLVSAKSNENENNNTNNINKNFIYPVKSESINISGEDIDLAIEFTDREEALKVFKETYNKELEFIKENFGMADISIENYNEYYNNFKNLNAESIPDYINESFYKILQFFDIFENDDLNKEVKNLNDLLLKSKESKLEKSTLSLESYISNDEYEIIEKINSLLPYNDVNISESNLITPYVAAGINLTNAINYASNYASLYTNYDKYGYIGGSDCTNFASQIREAGGVSQTSTWWHRRTTDTVNGNPIVKHGYSTSWINANTFVGYMGINYSTYNHYNFSANLRTGDFISADWGDGVWDHIGFVTADDSYAATYGGKYYYDYRVAQHSTDYHAWTSIGINGWESIEDDGGKYAIIGR